MAEVPVYNAQGQEVETVTVSDTVFGVPIKQHVVAEAFLAARAASRQTLAHVKERGEVRGGGRKPWRQKGTGRARHGSIRSPLWRGGGVTFGPRADRAFAVKINTKVRRAALRMALTDKLNSGKLVVIDALPSDGKTKTMAQARQALKGTGRTMLVAMHQKDDLAIRALNNIPKTEVISARSLNIADVLNHQYLLLTKQALKTVEKLYA